MQCLILAGGRGTRMRPMTDAVPKALIEVGGRPFIDRQLEWLAGHGVSRVVCSLGYRAEAVRAYLGDGAAWGLEAVCIEDGTPPLGTAGAIRKAIDEHLLDAGFLVLYGDSHLTIDVAAVWRASGQGARPLMTVFRNRGRWDTSNARFDDGRIVRFEKGLADPAAAGLDYIDYGLSVLTVNVVVEHTEAGRPADLANVFRELAAAGQLAGYEATKRFYEIGSPQGLAELEAHLKATGS